METQIKTKKTFQMPHLLFLLLGLMVVMSILTYILPAGEFVESVAGVNEYMQVDRTPVSLINVLLLIYNGIVNSAPIISLLLVIGGCVSVILGTKSIDRLIDFCLYKLQDKGTTILVPAMFMLLVLLGAFGGSDALIAVIPVGVMFAKKLKLDPIVAASTTLLATLVGFSTSPTGVYIAQMLMDVPVYSGFSVRVLNMLICGTIGAIYVTIYARRVEKNPLCSAMGNTDWQAELDNTPGGMEKKTLYVKDLTITVLFFAQFAAAIYFMLNRGMGMGVMPAVMIPVAVVCGLINGMKFNEIGKTFEEGVKGMAFVCLVVGFAGTISLIMREGKILDTIAYYASLPLQNLGSGLASIGISIVVMLLNFFIPSANAKAAALIPIIKPMAENLSISPQVAVQAFQIGDGFCNAISPFLGWTIGGLAIAKVPYQKWVKWVLPLIGIFLLVEYILLWILNMTGWA